MKILVLLKIFISSHFMTNSLLFIQKLFWSLFIKLLHDEQNVLRLFIVVYWKIYFFNCENIHCAVKTTSVAFRSFRQNVIKIKNTIKMRTLQKDSVRGFTLLFRISLRVTNKICLIYIYNGEKKTFMKNLSHFFP